MKLKDRIWELVRRDHTESEVARELDITVKRLRYYLRVCYLVPNFESMVRMVRQRQVNKLFTCLSSKTPAPIRKRS
jgi:hypothetical protein